MSNNHETNFGDNLRKDVQHLADDASQLGGQIWHDMRTQGPKIADYVTKTPAVGDVAGALCFVAIAAAPEAPPVAIGLGTLGATMFGAKAVWDLSKPGLEKVSESIIKFPTLNY